MGDTGFAGVMRRWTRWIGLPGWAQLALAVYAICFLEGAGSHVWDLTTRGIHAYDAVWWPSQALYFSLVALDAIAVHLALRAHPAVVPLGVAIMASDLTSNWHYNWSAIRADPALFWAPVGLLPMSLFGLFVAALGVPLWRVLRRRDAGQATPDIS